jgi:hypothetical protein
VKATANGFKITHDETSFASEESIVLVVEEAIHIIVTVITTLIIFL